MRILNIAAIQTAAVPLDVDATWLRFADQVRAVRGLFPHVQLVLAPELLLAAPAPMLESPASWMTDTAEPIDGPTVRRVCDLARETGLWLVPGSFFERDDNGRIFNTAIAVSPTGEVVAKYRKVFTWQPYEDAEPGTCFEVFDIPDVGRVGLAICYDGSFPETVRQLAWMGAEVVLQPVLTTTRDREMERVCARANAFSNQVYVVNLNIADPAGVGESLIVDPEGMVRQQAGGGEEVLVDALDLDAVTRVRTYGTAGLNRPWAQIAKDGANLRLPAYGGGGMVAPEWATRA
ncbi:carbon-nitrogen hydrolase family protein [Streptomyces sp. SID3343]|uniref:carbon-nitrogen hydrolase family protein n=1 Tax=Streptomyces sp. SID3343 TaxID=2690260 RepID=UPI001369ECDF|nr:carbon-nitrogen hydrolase family protein [Streptomyces sp. SID3343]MYV98027.1 carbon-nitrogen hydrolase family protein [Streptomyces sp. SID3343]